MKEAKPIPGFSRYGITRDARLFNLKTSRQLKTTRNHKGYRHTILVNDDGCREVVKRHRLVALTHLEPPELPVSDLMVNHKDLVPGNDFADSLEWCTHQENIEHYWTNGSGKTSPMPTESRTPATGEVERFSSIAACAKANGITRSAMEARVLKGPQWVWPDGKQYRLIDDGQPWPDETEDAVGRAREVLVKDLLLDVVLIYSKLGDVLDLLGYNLPAVWTWVNTPNQPVLPGLYQIQFADVSEPWREVEDPFADLESFMRGKVVVRLDPDWKHPTCYETARICGYHNHLKATALNFRLKTKGQKVWSDGYRFAYYSDLSEEQKKAIRYEVLSNGDAFNDYRKLQREYIRTSSNDPRIKSGSDESSSK